MFVRMATVIVALALLGSFSSCASDGPAAARGYELRVRYADVTEVRRVELLSAAPAGAVVGGFTDLVVAGNRSPGRQLATGAGGAALGALATRALEGERRGYSYTLRYADGGTTRFITEKGYLQRGDCVSVERGQYANIRRVSDVLCDGGITRNVDAEHLRRAERCHAAKDQLLQAPDDAAIGLAARKGAILCQDF